MDKIQIIFLSGAGLSTWVWDDVRAELNIPSVVVEYKNKNEGLAGYVSEVLDSIGQSEDKRVVIVAHSIGGVVGIEVAKRLDNRVAGIVAISAVIPKPSVSFASSLPFPQKIIMPLIMKFAGTKPPDTSIRNSLGKGLANEIKDRIVADYHPEARGLYTDTTSISSIPSIPAMYIVTTDDSEFTEQFQLSQAKRLTSPKLIRMKTGHLPMISYSSEVTRSLSDFIESLK